MAYLRFERFFCSWYFSTLHGLECKAWSKTQSLTRKPWEDTVEHLIDRHPHGRLKMMLSSSPHFLVMCISHSIHWDDCIFTHQFTIENHHSFSDNFPKVVPCRPVINFISKPWKYFQVGNGVVNRHSAWELVAEEKWEFPKIVVPQNGWFTKETPFKMDDLGVPPFKETPKWMHRFIVGSSVLGAP